MMRHIRKAYTGAVSGGLRLDARTGFQRSFLIFAHEDAGYEAGQKPSGHVKLEVREGRGKLHSMVQNLRPGNGRFEYKLYLLRTGRDKVVPVCAGRLVPEPNKAELEWIFDPRNVGMSGYDINEFDTAVVLVEYAERQGDTVICPLAAYKNKKTEWRSGFRTLLLKKRMEAVYVAEDNNANSAVLLAQSSNEESAGQPDTFDTYGSKAEDIKEDTAYDYGYQDNNTFSCEEEAAQALQAELMKQPSQPYPQQEQMQTPPVQVPLQVPLQMPLQQQMQFQQQMPLQQQMPPQPQMNPQPQMQQEQANSQYPGGVGQIDTGCVYLNGNMCGAFVNNGVSTPNPCDACRMHHGQAPAAVPPVGDITRLKEELERFFEQSDPFHSKRSDYIWWKVTNPVNLNNLLYQCNIRSPLLFNPAVMMAHYKYRHLIIGIFVHRARQKQYVVCGVPGMNMVDRKPFGEMSRWVQAEGNRPRYGAFGYWLVYIDPDDGKILNMSLE